MKNRQNNFFTRFAPLHETIFVLSIALIMAIILPGCSMHIDPAKAQTLTTNLLNDLQAENYSSLDQYYTTSFNESEPLDKKIEKFKRLKETMGSIKSFELTSSNETVNNDKGINELALKYKVTCERIVVDETFLVINDEGEVKIIFQNIENQK